MKKGGARLAAAMQIKKDPPIPSVPIHRLTPPSPFINAASLKTIYFADEDAPQDKIWRNKKTEERTIKASSPG